LRKDRPLQGLPEKSPRRLSLNKPRYSTHEKLALPPSTNKDNELVCVGTWDRKELLVKDLNNARSLLWRVSKQTPPVPHVLEGICSRIPLMCKLCCHWSGLAPKPVRIFKIEMQSSSLTQLCLRDAVRSNKRAKQ
jgi:hypothetical protein